VLEPFKGATGRGVSFPSTSTANSIVMMELGTTQTLTKFFLLFTYPNSQLQFQLRIGKLMVMPINVIR